MDYKESSKEDDIPMKRITALIVCILTVLTVFAACAPSTEKGPNIPISLTTEISNFDPAYANLDDASVKVLGLIYEGLFRLNEDGEAEYAQAEKVKVLDDPDEDYYAIEITLKNTSWSDGTLVQAADYIYAWKRILEPEFRGEAASLLFDIKNARAVNSGDASVDDLGISDVQTDVILIEFEGKTDYKQFYRKLASIMLVPLRESVIDKVKKDWSSNPTVLVCNGPFMVRSYKAGDELILERNVYYCRDIEKDDLNESVEPYRLTIDLSMSPEEALEAYEAGKIAYIGEIPLSKRADYLSSKKVTVNDELSVMSVMFNTKKAPFDKAEVRRALSLAIDRNEIVKLLTFAKPAQGLIADGVFNAGYSKKAETFRKAGKKLISDTADVKGAKSLLSAAGVNGGDITLTVRKNSEGDLAVAEYIKGVWTSLGFNVTIEKLSPEFYTDENQYDLVKDHFADKYESGDFDAMLFDNNMISTEAFENLAMYSKAFAGGAMNMDISSDDDDYELATHISGYYNANYDKKIEKAFAEKDLEKRAKILHEAEEILMQDMPVIPLVQLQEAYAADDNLDGLARNYFGYELFTEAELDNADQYSAEETAAQ